MRGAVRWPVLVAAAMLLAACGGGADGDDVAAEAPGDDTEIDFEDLDEMREQLEELGQAAEEFELDPVEQDADRPLLLPADVRVTGDLEGTYTENPGCDVAEQYIDPDDGYHEGVLVVRFGWAGHTFDWTSELPDDPRPLTVLLAVPNFTGGGSYEGFVSLAGVEPWAAGTADVTIVENRREEFPTGDIIVIEGSFSGTYAGAAGSGDVSGDLGVCNVRAP